MHNAKSAKASESRASEINATTLLTDRLLNGIS